MKRGVIFCLVILSLAVLCSVRVNAAYGTAQGSDWKWSYAQTYVNDDLSKMTITDQDIAFAKMRNLSAEKDCTNMGGVWCEWAKNDSLALDRMLKAQGNQVGAPAKDASLTVWAKFVNMLKKLFGLS